MQELSLHSGWKAVNWRTLMFNQTMPKASEQRLRKLEREQERQKIRLEPLLDRLVQENAVKVFPSSRPLPVEGRLRHLPK